MIMAPIDGSHETRTGLPGHSSRNVIREFAGDFSRAQQAAAMADADHRHPERIRELYLMNASVPRIPTADPAYAGSGEDMTRMRQLAVAVKLSGRFAVVGLVATIVRTTVGGAKPHRSRSPRG